MRMRTCVVALVAVSLLLWSGVLVAQQPAPQPAPQKESAPAKEAAPQQGTSWSGKLVDADCRASKPDDPCEATADTANFGIVTSENAYYKLDAKGNKMAKDKLKDNKKEGGSAATITGRMEGDTITVETLKIGE